ncbi:carbohydrate kinase family protein, partial [bacterium]|nr:carbohydrate kinase family protein [bacterium]MBU1634122.1 carbohydrate kinase family protein [bacterium]
MKKPLPRKYKNPFAVSPAKTKTSNFDVLTIGAATRDVFVQSSRFKNIKDPAAPDGLDACFPLGAKIDLNNVVFETGGGATNAAVTFARFGLKTACVARVGKDPGGKEIKKKLTNEGIDTSYIQTDDKQCTGYSFILVSDTGQRAILVYRGASAKIDAKLIDWKRIKPEWIYLTSLAGDETLLKKVFLEAKKSGARIVWNPGNAELHLGHKKLTPYLLQCDILLLNREEAAA